MRLEYQVVGAESLEQLKKEVEVNMNDYGWKLHGGVSSTYVPPQMFPNGEVRCNDGWVFHQCMVRGEGGRKKALEKYA